MIQVIILNSITGRAYGGTFLDSTLANAWIAQEEANNSWGRPARIILSNSEEINDENLSRAISNSPVMTNNPAYLDANGNPVVGQNATIPLLDYSGNPVLSYSFPADYAITQTDITAQHTMQQAVAQALANQSIGATIVANVAAINEQMLATSGMTQNQFNALLADQTILNIERLLWNGSLITAKALINANLSDLEQYYSSAQINQILALFPV